mmetsp:Transcript_44173/g.108502  ORF Transcript_44173/g.108502 Transcript_44173/m.108502 type:complete len:239 (-) Transcript_44173:23-739(-)
MEDGLNGADVANGGLDHLALLRHDGEGLASLGLYGGVFGQGFQSLDKCGQGALGGGHLGGRDLAGDGQVVQYRDAKTLDLLLGRECGHGGGDGRHNTRGGGGAGDLGVLQGYREDLDAAGLDGGAGGGSTQDGGQGLKGVGGLGEAVAVGAVAKYESAQVCEVGLGGIGVGARCGEGGQEAVDIGRGSHGRGGVLAARRTGQRVCFGGAGSGELGQLVGVAWRFTRPQPGMASGPRGA